jgi:putative transposase
MMPDYRRAFRPGGTFFFTLVTYRRAQFLCDDLARALLRQAIDACRAVAPFEVGAFVLLPDHLHAIWTLPAGDADFSTRWARVKRSFTRAWVAAGGWEGAVSDSRRQNRRRGVWQRRFWEHVIRDETDLRRHLDYIHYNPIKHRLADCAHAWQWSSFHRLVREGAYDPTWCCGCGGRAPVAVPDFGGLDTEGIEAAFGE